MTPGGIFNRLTMQEDHIIVSQLDTFHFRPAQGRERKREKKRGTNGPN